MAENKKVNVRNLNNKCISHKIDLKYFSILCIGKQFFLLNVGFKIVFIIVGLIEINQFHLVVWSFHVVSDCYLVFVDAVGKRMINDHISTRLEGSISECHVGNSI